MHCVPRSQTRAPSPGPDGALGYNSPMDERFRLVFRGETLDGQHTAVVKKKLGQILKITEAAKLDHLFAGKPVVIRRDVDKAQAAKFQAAFKKVGARLRVLPVVLSVEELEAQEAAEKAQAEADAIARMKAAAPQEADFGDSAAWAVMPAGMPIFKDGEREEPEVVDVPTAHIKLEAPVAFVVDDPEEETAAEPEPEIAAPDFDVAQPGATIGAVDGSPGNSLDEIDIDSDLTMAEPGVELVPPSVPPEVPENLLDVPYDVAEPGADMGEGVVAAEPPPLPDVSHIELALESEPEPEKLDARKIFGVVSDDEVAESSANS